MKRWVYLILAVSLMSGCGGGTGQKVASPTPSDIEYRIGQNCIFDDNLAVTVTKVEDAGWGSSVQVTIVAKNKSKSIYDLSSVNLQYTYGATNLVGTPFTLMGGEDASKNNPFDTSNQVLPIGQSTSGELLLKGDGIMPDNSTITIYNGNAYTKYSGNTCVFSTKLAKVKSLGSAKQVCNMLDSAFNSAANNILNLALSAQNHSNLFSQDAPTPSHAELLDYFKQAKSISASYMKIKNLNTAINADPNFVNSPPDLVRAGDVLENFGTFVVDYSNFIGWEKFTDVDLTVLLGESFNSDSVSWIKLQKDISIISKNPCSLR